MPEDADAADAARRIMGYRQTFDLFDLWVQILQGDKKRADHFFTLDDLPD